MLKALLGWLLILAGFVLMGLLTYVFYSPLFILPGLGLVGWGLWLVLDGRENND